MQQFTSRTYICRPKLFHVKRTHQSLKAIFFSDPHLHLHPPLISPSCGSPPKPGMCVSPSCGPWSDCLWFGLSDYYPPVVWEGTLPQAGNKPSFSASKDWKEYHNHLNFWANTALNLLLCLAWDILAFFSGGISVI